MARTWITIEVQLVSGRGEDFWPRPGRVLLAKRSTSFRELAGAIDTAFGRWDLAHLHRFWLAGGEEIVPLEWWEDGTGEELDDANTTVAKLIAGEQFAYEFDLGDGWEHLCTVGLERVDPKEMYGAAPDGVVIIGSWGTVPDQHGRRWADDDGVSEPPPRPEPATADLPALLPHWGEASQRPAHLRAVPSSERAVEVSGWDKEAAGALRAAVAQRDAAAILGVLRPRDPLPVGQLAGDGLLIALEQGANEAMSHAHALARALRERRAPGDEELADDLIKTSFHGGADRLPGVPVDLDDLAMELYSDESMGSWRLDLQSGRMWPDDPLGMAGEEPPDHWDDDELWLRVDSLGSKAGWNDMADFIDTVTDPELASELRNAISGRGAFRSFKDLVFADDNLAARWHLFSDDRERGRAREWLAEHGYRATGQPR